VRHGDGSVSFHPVKACPNNSTTGGSGTPKKRRLSEADTNNGTIGDASETCSGIETDLEDDDASSDSDDNVIKPDSDDDAGDEGDKDDDIEVVLEDRDEDDDHDVDASDLSGWDDIVIELNSDDAGDEVG
jgi:hypothetical protein